MGNFHELNLASDHRITVLGGTGDGKSTIAQKIIQAVRQQTGSKQPIVVLNPAAEDKYYDELGDGHPGIDLTWPKIQHVCPLMTSNYKKFAPLWRAIFEKGNLVVLTDEIAAMSSASVYPDEMMYVYQMGRRRNILNVGISQKPVRIPTFVLDMSDHILIGDIRGKNLRHMEDFIDYDLHELMAARGQYEFIYWTKHDKEPPKLIRL